MSKSISKKHKKPLSSCWLSRCYQWTVKSEEYPVMLIILSVREYSGAFWWYLITLESSSSWSISLLSISYLDQNLPIKLNKLKVPLLKFVAKNILEPSFVLNLQILLWQYEVCSSINLYLLLTIRPKRFLLTVLVPMSVVKSCSIIQILSHLALSISETSLWKSLSNFWSNQFWLMWHILVTPQNV